MSKEVNVKRIRLVLMLVTLCLALVLSVHWVQTLITENFLVVDESYDYDQIMKFALHGFELAPDIPAVRGYHLAIAVILRLFNNQSTVFLRYVVLLVNLASIPAVYFFARSVDKEWAGVKTLQYVWMPVVFPFFGLMYTDIMSLTLVVLGTLLLVKKNYLAAGVMVSLSLFVRQNNIVWLVFLFLWAYIQENGMKLSPGRVRKHLLGNIVMIAGAVGFLIFVVLNKGVAIGESEMHPLTVTNLGNVYFFALVFLVMFLPVNLAGLVRVFRMIKKHKWMMGMALFWLVVFLVTFDNSHPFNQSDFFLRNRALVFLSSDIWHKILFYCLAVWGALSMGVLKLLKKEFYLVLPMTVLLLAPEWLIEQRYYMIPLIMLLVSRKVEKPWVEYLMLGGYVAATLVLYTGISGNQYFL